MSESLSLFEKEHRQIWPELYDSAFPSAYEIVKLDKGSNADKANRMQFKYNDGGRNSGGFKGQSRDCVARSISIVSGIPYKTIYNDLALANRKQRASSKTPKRQCSANHGVNTTRKWFKDYMNNLGFKWIPTMQVGSKNRIHLRQGDLPNGKLLVHVSRHYTAVINGVINDTHDCSRNGNRCVYGYWIKEQQENQELCKS